MVMTYELHYIRLICNTLKVAIANHVAMEASYCSFNLIIVNK